MPTRNVVLTDYQASLVERLVRSGRYQNASEVLREGLRLIERREAEEKARLKALRDAVSTGVADADAGRFQELESPEDLRAYLGSVAEEVITKAGSRKRAR
jgi:antitoxin ParD1/3/4